MDDKSTDFETVIFRMTRTVNGRKIRRADGKPWKIVLRNKNKR